MKAAAKKAAENKDDTDDGSDGCITVTVECFSSYINGENVRWNDEIKVIEDENAQNEDTVVGHRYCVCGAVFDFHKSSSLDNDAWMAHAL